MSNQDVVTDAEKAALYQTLGKELRAVQEEAAASSGLESLRAMTEGNESLAGLTALGESFFERISASAYAIVCGSAEGNADWKTLTGLGQAALIGAVAGLLMAHLALVATVASAVASLIVKLFFDAGSKELCSRWKASLPAAT